MAIGADVLVRLQKRQEQLRARGFTGAEAQRIAFAQLGRPGDSDSVTADEVAVALPSRVVLVATQPEQLVAAMSTLDAFRFVIASADAQLRVSSPFIEADGIPPLERWLRDAASRRVALSLMDRESAAAPSSGAARDALRTVFGASFKHVGYHVADERGQLLGLHAKLFIADAKVAYVGSADVRARAITRNFEVGVLVADPLLILGMTRWFDGLLERGSAA